MTRAGAVRDHPLLVTGGAGFFGSAFVRTALGHGASVVTLDALTYAGHLDNLGAALSDPRHAFVHGDVTDAALLGRVFAEHAPRAVVHFAAETHVDRSIDDAAPFVTTNVLGTVRLLEASRAALAAAGAEARAGFRFVQISTDEVYGSSGAGRRFREDDRLAPRSPYAASKAAADGFVQAYAATFDLPARIVRCSNLYGPRQFAEKLIPLAIRRALSGQPIGVYGDGKHARSWFHVDDACDAVWRALGCGAPAPVLHVGGAELCANLEVVHRVCDLVDGLVGPDEAMRTRGAGSRRDLVTFVADRPGHDRAYALDTSATARILGWAPRIGLAEGLADTVRWYVDNRAFLDRGARAYDGERLGLGARRAPGSSA